MRRPFVSTVSKCETTLKASCRAPRGKALAPLVLLLSLALPIGVPGADASSANSPAARSPAVKPLLSDEQEIAAAIRFFTERVKRDPGDVNAQNRLAYYHLQRLKETNNSVDLDLATRAALVSLATVPAERNLSGLAMLAQAEQFAHDFAASRDHGRQLLTHAPKNGYFHEILGDALLELGEYEKAEAAFLAMERIDGASVDSETRRARLAFLRGKTRSAQQHYANAIELASRLASPPRQSVAWCYWQMGEMAFSGGDYADAERRYRAALTVFPDYYHALAGVGKVKAAGGDRSGAIDYYKRAIERFPDLAWLAALGDLYRLTERHAEAAAQYKIVTDIGRLNKTNGQLYSRQLALFYADHDREPAEASANAVREYAAGRRDIYGADALAWTALKSDKLTQARTAIKEALRLGTLDAMLFYHAGMIARAAGDNAEARRYLTHALALNPQFDPLQASLARRALQVRAE